MFVLYDVDQSDVFSSMLSNSNDNTIVLSSTFDVDSYINLFSIIYSETLLTPNTQQHHIVDKYRITARNVYSMLPILYYYNVEPYLQECKNLTTQEISSHMSDHQSHVIELIKQHNTPPLIQACESYIDWSCYSVPSCIRNLVIAQELPDNALVDKILNRMYEHGKGLSITRLQQYKRELELEPELYHNSQLQVRYVLKECIRHKKQENRIKRALNTYHRT